MKRPRPKAGQREQRASINEEITAPEVRLIGPDGGAIGIVSNREAQQAADDAKLDLVEISPQAEPPVCKIMDYGKFVFEQKKAKAAAKKKQTIVHVKEIKFRPGTDIGDYNVKLRKLTQFLTDGDKTKITVRFRGREMAHKELGMELLGRVEKDLAEFGEVEARPKLEGRQMIMVIAPKKKK
ncbi:translation initiation factor IF-3 [Aliikangiella marina]|uniref:Translation initiation factor IF-3 n=1 Tax=Aliikangiella marina TaxID=1712262 RepID=A0A545TIL2_9GAMM|nr:translation initiation factor IF-3 [Aliikangiella marina]TQV77047.1 translation initiation factor IF-3 [Aliikangiella marina]